MCRDHSQFLKSSKLDSNSRQECFAQNHSQVQDSKKYILTPASTSTCREDRHIRDTKKLHPHNSQHVVMRRTLTGLKLIEIFRSLQPGHTVSFGEPKHCTMRLICRLGSAGDMHTACVISTCNVPCSISLYALAPTAQHQ